MNLKLYQYYTRDEIFAAFANSQPTKAEGWFTSGKQLIGLFAIGERPPVSHFCDNGRFHWHGQEGETVPQPIQEFKKLKGAHLFIKAPAHDRYAYVCEIQHVGMHGGGPGGYEACMDISPNIPTPLLHELGGLYVHPDGDRAMDAPIAALRAAKTPLKRFAAFRKFVEAWRGPIDLSLGLSEDEIGESTLPTPKILASLYRWAGKCEDVMHAGYLSFRKPDELTVNEHGFVAVCVECQWCGNYFVREEAMRDDDPEMFADECGDDRDGQGYHATGITLSQFLWGYYIAFNAAGGPISHQVELSLDEFQQLRDKLEPLPVLAAGCQSCRAIEAYRPEIDDEDEAVIYAKHGVMGVATRGNDGASLTLRSKSQPAIDQLIESLDLDPSRLKEAF